MKKSILIIGAVFLLGATYFLFRNSGDMDDSDTTDSSLSKYEVDTINSYKTKYQKFPGPSDEEVFKVSNILLSKNFSKDKIEQLLGEPSDISKTPDNITGKVLLERFSYDIGDSRRISILYDSSGSIKSIEGVGVGFDILPIPK